MNANVLTVQRDGTQWGVAAGDEVMALARTKRQAETLARDAVAILRASGVDASMKIAAEPRSFKSK